MRVESLRDTEEQNKQSIKARYGFLLISREGTHRKARWIKRREGDSNTALALHFSCHSGGVRTQPRIQSNDTQGRLKTAILVTEQRTLVSRISAATTECEILGARNTDPPTKSHAPEARGRTQSVENCDSPQEQNPTPVCRDEEEEEGGIWALKPDPEPIGARMQGRRGPGVGNLTFSSAESPARDRYHELFPPCTPAGS